VSSKQGSLCLLNTDKLPAGGKVYEEKTACTSVCVKFVGDIGLRGKTQFDVAKSIKYSIRTSKKSNQHPLQNGSRPCGFMNLAEQSGIQANRYGRHTIVSGTGSMQRRINPNPAAAFLSSQAGFVDLQINEHDIQIRPQLMG
jgi:hypothetical protein